MKVSRWLRRRRQGRAGQQNAHPLQSYIRAAPVVAIRLLHRDLLFCNQDSRRATSRRSHSGTAPEPKLMTKLASFTLGAALLLSGCKDSAKEGSVIRFGHF